MSNSFNPPCEKHKVERCLTCFAHVPGSAAAPERTLADLQRYPKCKSADHVRIDHHRAECMACHHVDEQFNFQPAAAAPSGPGLRELATKLVDNVLSIHRGQGTLHGYEHDLWNGPDILLAQDTARTLRDLLAAAQPEADRQRRD